MSEAPAAAPPAPAADGKPAPIPPLDPTKPLPKVFERFDGGELPGFLRVWVEETPQKIDLRAIVEDTELSIEQLKGDWTAHLSRKVLKYFSSQQF